MANPVLASKAGTVAIQLSNTEALPISELYPAQQPVRLLVYSTPTLVRSGTSLGKGNQLRSSPVGHGRLPRYSSPSGLPGRRRHAADFFGPFGRTLANSPKLAQLSFNGIALGRHLWTSRQPDNYVVQPASWARPLGSGQGCLAIEVTNHLVTAWPKHGCSIRCRLRR